MKSQLSIIGDNSVTWLELGTVGNFLFKTTFVVCEWTCDVWQEGMWTLVWKNTWKCKGIAFCYFRDSASNVHVARFHLIDIVAEELGLSALIVDCIVEWVLRLYKSTSMPCNLQIVCSLASSRVFYLLIYVCTSNFVTILFQS